MDFTEQMLVLRVGRFKEADLWVRLLSPERGLISAFAFGGAISRRRFAGCLDILNLAQFHLKGNRSGYLALQEGALVQGPRRLRTDWQRLGLAANCLKFVESCGVSAGEGALSSFFLVRDLIYLLEHAEALPEQLPLLFRLRFVFEQGYALALDVCSRCSASLSHGDEAWFMVQEGYLCCAACQRSSAAARILLSAEALDALRFVREYPLLRWTELVLSGVPRQQVCRAIDRFIAYHVGILWDNGRFVRV